MTLEVRDTGTGISNEDMPNVFDPFFSTKKDSGGTGLGLSVCKSLIEQMNGQLEIVSTRGAGTKVTVTLPAAIQDAIATPILAPSRSIVDRSPIPPRLRVLIIDDDRLVARVLKRALSTHEVMVCHSGSEAMGILATIEHFDLILCDLMMPDVSGIDVYDHLFERNSSHLSRFVFVTGGAFTPQSQEFLMRVNAAVLTKPVDLKELDALVEKYAPDSSTAHSQSQLVSFSAINPVSHATGRAPTMPKENQRTKSS